jgi:hypothetical protein
MAKREGRGKKTDIYKIATVIILTAIVVFALAAFVFKYYPEMKRESEINAYKKAVYSTILCQYKCPLTPQFVSQVNRTEAVPDEVCVQNCTISLMNVNSSNIKSEELMNDNLAKDIQDTLLACKSGSQVYNLTLVGQAVNTAMFFSCAIDGLESLKENYSYLK